MPGANTASFELPLRALLYVIPPMIVIGAASYLINNYGFPLDHLANATVQNGHAEAAGRLRVLATWLLLACVGIGCIAYCGWNIYSLARTTALRLGALYLVLAAGGVLLILNDGMEGGQRMLDRRVVCAAFSLGESPQAAGATNQLTTYGPPPTDVADDAFACEPGNESYKRLWWLNQIQKFILVLLLPALVLGTISCRALPGIPDIDDCRDQIGRLNLHLYLIATALVSGLLFLSALLHWPAFAFAEAAAKAYNSHVDAYILYWGVSYSLLIASVYVPVAIDLNRACAGSAAAETGDPAPADPKDRPAADLLGPFKTAAALFAPAIAGLLGGVISL
jgi:hypothetical protein